MHNHIVGINNHPIPLALALNPYLLHTFFGQAVNQLVSQRADLA